MLSSLEDDIQIFWRQESRQKKNLNVLLTDNLFGNTEVYIMNFKQIDERCKVQVYFIPVVKYFEMSTNHPKNVQFPPFSLQH